mmetsp:Transcript_86350/g.244777  ORF Transcript_86350/g.244777 Transcript_86350/m.244777 type:complete len:211 (+) Transcript_86350:302-934(+)
MVTVIRRMNGKMCTSASVNASPNRYGPPLCCSASSYVTSASSSFPSSSASLPPSLLIRVVNCMGVRTVSQWWFSSLTRALRPASLGISVASCFSVSVLYSQRNSLQMADSCTMKSLPREGTRRAGTSPRGLILRYHSGFVGCMLTSVVLKGMRSSCSVIRVRWAKGQVLPGSVKNSTGAPGAATAAASPAAILSAPAAGAGPTPGEASRM